MFKGLLFIGAVFLTACASPAAVVVVSPIPQASPRVIPTAVVPTNITAVVIPTAVPEPTVSVAEVVPTAVPIVEPPTVVVPSTITVDMLDNTFSTPQVIVVAGIPIVLTFHNEGKNMHNFNLKGVAKTPLITAGQSAVLTFTLAPGAYTFVCDVHPTTMIGALIAE